MRRLIEIALAGGIVLAAQGCAGSKDTTVQQKLDILESVNDIIHKYADRADIMFAWPLSAEAYLKQSAGVGDTAMLMVHLQKAETGPLVAPVQQPPTSQPVSEPTSQPTSAPANEEAPTSQPAATP